MISPQEKTHFLKVEDATKTYVVGDETVHALDHVDFSVRRGELVMILGPSGSGKTTLVEAISGLLPLDSGSIYITDKQLPINNDRGMSLYRNKYIGFVFQNYSLLPHYSVLENVELPMIIAGVGKSTRKRRALEYLELVGLTDSVDWHINQLSGGQRQRVSIARALTMHAKLLIADEPTGNLDSERSEQIVSFLKEICRKRHTTVIMVTHNEELAVHADRVFYMQDGKLSEVYNESK